MLARAEEAIDDQRIDMQGGEIFESIVDFAVTTGVQDIKLRPLCTCRILYVSE
jgi:hypothetical protein